jgi:hypothetical protein
MDTSELEGHIDDMVYVFYALTPEEIVGLSESSISIQYIQ